MGALRLSPVWRLSLKLAAVAVVLLVALDLALELMPRPSQIAQKTRQDVSGAIAVQIAVLVADTNARLLERTLNAIVLRNPDIQSIGVRQRDGHLLAQSSEHARLWRPPSEDGSTLTHVHVPLRTAEGLWGKVGIAYAPTERGVLGWLREFPLLVASATVGGLCVLLFSAHLRRTLQELHPARGRGSVGHLQLRRGAARARGRGPGDVDPPRGPGAVYG